MEKKNELGSYLDTISLLLLGIVLVAFPLSFTSLTTDAFSVIKQVIVAASVLILLVLFGIKMINNGKISIKRTPFDLPLILLLGASLLSTFLSLNRFDSALALVPFVMAILSYFVIINTAKSESSVLFLISSLVIGATVVSVLSVLSFFKIYILPFQFTHAQAFTPLGSLLDEALYLAFVLGVTLTIIWPVLTAKKAKELTGTPLVFALLSIVITIGLSITIYKLFVIQKPLLLPYETGFQTAFAAISQDSNRVIPGFLSGSGFGTYNTVFTRFKQVAYNYNPTLWSFTFFRSSSFVLELLATTGVLGLLSFLYLSFQVVKSKKNGKHHSSRTLFVTTLGILIAAFLLPFSYITYTLFFVVLGLYASVKALQNSDNFFEVDLHLVAARRGLFNLVSSDHQTKRNSKILPVGLLLVIILIVGSLGFQIVRFAISDFQMQKSLVAASQNNAQQLYDEQNKAIQGFPYRDAYYRIFSQTNFTLANNFASSQPKNASPSAKVQQDIYTLIQQSINSARRATQVAPLTSLNWTNLSNIYKGLIGFGQNAEQFALVTAQQAVALDPNNPQLYINLGGIFYQLKQWDNAQRQFQIAIQLKPDLANAYYNLGHALEEKGELQTALTQYQTVKSLVSSDKDASKRIEDEIAKLEGRIGDAAQKGSQAALSPTDSEQSPLEISTPSAKLPVQKEPVKIPAPESVSPTPTPTEKVTGTPTPQP